METNKCKMNKLNKMFLFAFLFIFVISVSILCVSAYERVTSYVIAEELNLTSEQQATECLAESKQIIKDMSKDGFSVERLNDTLAQTELIYAGLIKNRKKDFSIVTSSCDDIKTAKELAYTSRDEILALKKFYNKSLSLGMDVSSIDILIKEIENELESGRYEVIKDLVDNAYDKIIEVKSSYTTINLFKDYTTGFFSWLFFQHWKGLLISIGIFLVLFFIYKTKVMSWIIKNKIANLEVRRKILKDLIRKTQRDYFEYGKISEGAYNIKTKKFAELIRDVDRQTPLLREELIKIERGKGFSLLNFGQTDGKKKQKAK